jgi:hypothetical protein
MQPSSATDPPTSGPRELVAEIEAHPDLPDGSGERFAGYGVMGLPFVSGHILAVRRLPASSVGPGYRSVWHRDPDGRWTFFQDVPSICGCPRYFGAAIAEVATATIDIAWDGPRQFSVTATDGNRRLDWRVTLTSSAITRVWNAVSSLLPEAVWRHRLFLAGMGMAAGPMLRAGKVRLTGRAPNGQQFEVNPRLIWLVADSEATLDGVDLGAIGPSPTPGRMADFWLPQRGMFAIGRAFFQPTQAVNLRSQATRSHS